LEIAAQSRPVKFMKNDHSEVLKKARFNLAIKVKPEDIDGLGHVNNVVYLGWVQLVAATHWNSLTTPEIRSKNIWVALRHEVDYLNPAFLGDEIMGYTWVSSLEGVKSIRHVEFYRSEKCLAKAKTNWCLLDAGTLKPRRIGQDIKILLEM
jgi:acyl-CoA thioester hydrolase